MNVKRLLSLALMLSLAGCATTRPPGSDPNSSPPAPSISAEDQCSLMQAAVSTGDLAIIIADIKGQTARIAVDSAFAGLQGAADKYCAAVAAGEEVNGLSVFLAAYNDALREFKAAMRAARNAKDVSALMSKMPLLAGTSLVPMTRDRAMSKTASNVRIRERGTALALLD